MLEVVIFGLLAGLDNLQVCSALGLLPIQRGRMHWLAATFCASEICGAVLGLLLGRAVFRMLGESASFLAPLIMLGCGCCVVYLALRRDEVDLEKLVNNRALLLGLPLSLSLDNMVAGAGISFSSYPLLASALLIGAISAAMSCLALYLGNRVRRFLPERIEVAIGVYICLLAVRMILQDTQ